MCLRMSGLTLSGGGSRCQPAQQSPHGFGVEAADLVALIDAMRSGILGQGVGSGVGAAEDVAVAEVRRALLLHGRGGCRGTGGQDGLR